MIKKSFRRAGLCLFGFAVIFGTAFAVLPLPGDVPVLMYHFAGTEEDARESKNYVSEKSFARQMAFLKIFGYRIISLDDYYAIRSGKRAGRGREILLTFDDGDLAFEKKFYPVLRQYGFPAAIFVVSESMKRNLPGSMSAETVKGLLEQGLVSVGSHSSTHPFLSKMTEDQIRPELLSSREDLEEMLGVPVQDFAYPYGDYDQRVAQIVEESGYRLAFTTSHKKLTGARPGNYDITRTKITRSSDHFLIFWVKISGLYGFFKGVRHEIKSILK